MKFSIKSGILSLIGLFLVQVSLAQEVLLIDALTQEPLEGVLVINQKKDTFLSSDKRGRFDLDFFNPKDRLLFQLIGYESIELNPDEIKERAYTLPLFLDEKKLSEIVLSVARTAAQSKKIAEKVAVINKSNIQNFAPSTGADLLELAPSVRLQKSQGGGGSPVLRGFEANRVLLVVDGVRLNNAIYRSGHLQNALTVDPNSIERVEVIYGSSSVGYGSDALGGVVHYFTKTPKINNAKPFSSQFNSQYKSAQNTFIYHLENEASFKRWAVYSSLTVSNYGDIVMGANRQHGYNQWGLVPTYSANTEHAYFESPTINPNPNIQKNSGYSQIDFLQKLVINLPKENQLTFNVQWSNSSDIPRFDKLNEMRDGELRFAEWNYGPQQRILISPQLKFYPKKKWLYKGTITAAFQHIEESRIKRRFDVFTKETQAEKVDVFSLNGDFETTKKQNVSLAYGFEWIYNQINSDAFSQELLIRENEVIGSTLLNPIPTRYPSDGSAYMISALYGNYRLDLTPKMTISVGGRLTATQLDANWNEAAMIDADLRQVNIKNNALTGSLAFSYRPDNSWRINLLFSSGFRAPNIDDLGKIRENRGWLLVPNPGLKPEFVYNIDGGISFIPRNDKLELNARFYVSSLRDYIGRLPYHILSDTSTEEMTTIQFGEELVTTQANSNIGNASIYGASFEGLWKWNSYFSLLGNLTYTHAPHNESIGPLPSILPFFGGGSARFQTDQFQLSFSMRFNAAKSPEDYSLGGEDGLEETPLIIGEGDYISYAGNPKWMIYSIHSNYYLKKNLSVNLALENLFDLHYRTFASGISAPGRSLNIGVKVTF